MHPKCELVTIDSVLSHACKLQHQQDCDGKPHASMFFQAQMQTLHSMKVRALPLGKFSEVAGRASMQTLHQQHRAGMDVGEAVNAVASKAGKALDPLRFRKGYRDRSARHMHAQLTHGALGNCSFTYISIHSCDIQPVTCMNEKHEQHIVRCCSTEMAGKD